MQLSRRSLLATITLVAAGAGSLAACSSSSSSSSGAGSAACQASCDAQAAGCPASGSDYAATCKAFCSLVPASCATQYDAYAKCSDAVGWQCSSTVTINGKPAPEVKDSTQCQTEEAAYSTCTSAAAPKCAGSDANGFCPSIMCACPSGTVSISGSQSNGSGGCTCYDATTCTAGCSK